MIKLTHLHTYTGPSPYAPEPSLIISLEIGAEELRNARQRITKVTQAFSSWFNYTLPEQSVNELETGEFLVSFSLALLTEVRGFLNVAKVNKSEETLKLIIGYHVPKVSLLALRLAVNIYTEIERTNLTLLIKKIDEFWLICKRFHPDYQAGILMKAAQKNNIPVLAFLNNTKYWQYGWGEKSRIFMESLSNADGQLASTISRNKPLSKMLFQSLGIPCPRHLLINSTNDLARVVSEIGYPCVVKPTDRGGGKGVTANIKNFSELQNAFNVAHQLTNGPVMIEQHVAGDDHRLMVIDGRFAAAIRREPATIIGDGQRSIRHLIEEINTKRSINMIKSSYLRPIPVDNILVAHLSKQGKDLESILIEGERVSLRSNANLSTGGICVDVTEKTHPTIQRLVEQLSRTVGFGTAGFDYLTTDISISPLLSKGAFIEMNTTPGLDATIAAGWIAEKIGSLVLGDFIGRIPIHLIISNSLENLPAKEDPIYANSSAAKVYSKEVHIGECVYRIDDPYPWAAVNSALKNKSVQSLEIFCTASEIISYGLPVDRIDKIIVTDARISENWLEVLKKHSSELVVSEK